jgi:hypothetical protein
MNYTSTEQVSAAALDTPSSELWNYNTLLYLYQQIWEQG